MPDTEPVAPPTTPPRAEDLEAALKRIQVVDISEAIGAHAIDAADAYISSETSQHGVRGFAKRIWKGNLARDIIRQRKIQQSRRQIIESDNIYAASGGEMADHIQATAAVVERFTSDYDLLHRQAGETNESLEASEHGQALLNQLRQLIGEFAHNPAMGTEALEEAKNRILHDYGRRAHGKDRNRGLMYADNILEVAAQARFAAEHELARERIEAALSGHIGEARMGVRTKARLEVTDKALDWLHRHGGGSLINEGTLGIGLAVAMSVTKFTTRSTLSAAARVIVPGIGAGAYAGLREHFRVGQERTLHMRQMAEGGELPPDQAPRREKMEQNRYETISATELIEQLENVGELLDDGNILAAIAAINAAEIRTGISDQRSLDLISYSGKTLVENERFALDLSLSQAKVLLNRKLDSLSDEELSGLGLTSRDGAQALARHTAELAENLVGDISEKDKIFRKLRRQRTLKMAAVGAVAGVSLGLIFQELHSLADDGLRGVAEGPGGDRQSLLAAIFRHAHHSGNPDVSNYHNEFVNNDFHHHTGLNLPPDYHLVQEKPGGAWDLVNEKGDTIYHHFRWDSQGKPARGILDYLHSQGWNFQEHHIGYTTHHMETSHVARSPHEYLRAHPHDFVRAHRELWYDNNTPGVYDQNELRLDWGAGGVGIDSQGNYVFNVSSMYPGGSFHEGLSTNAQALVHEGKIAIALSMSHDTQQYVHFVHIDSDGNAVIPADSPLGHSLFEVQNGHAHFTGGYAEAVQLMGKTSDGGESMRMLATVVGDNHPNQLIDVTHHLSGPVHKEHFITSLIPPAEDHPPIEVPPVIPIYSRKGLENLSESEPRLGSEGYFGYGNYDYLSAEQRKEWEEQRSPRLREDPDGDLVTGDELDWYRGSMSKRRGREYVGAIDKDIDSDPVLKSIGKETKALVCIPVAAASESDNIYKTLALYHQQNDKAKEATTIVLNVNWVQSLEDEPEQLARIQKTLSEVERAKADFPDLKIAVIQKRWSPEFMAKRKNRIYGEVIKVLYDTAAMAIDRAIREGRRSGDQETILITNDADAQGLRRDYLDRYIQSLETEPTADIFSGLIRWGTKEYSDYPGYGVANGFYGLLSMMTYRYGKGKNPWVPTTGPNSGFRLSAYAAVGGCEDRNDLGASADAVLGFRVAAARTARPRRPSTKPKRTVAKYVTGAQVDSAADRLLGAYRQGKWLAEGWYGFNNGGYQDRTEVNAGGTLGPEVVERDIDDIAARIETNISGFASNWYKDKTVVGSALALFFGQEFKGTNPKYKGQALYRAQWRDGKFYFRFTDAGKELLKIRLMRDRRGQFDHYGRRIRRQLYNEIGPESVRTPKVAAPRFVAHTE